METLYWVITGYILSLLLFYFSLGLYRRYGETEEEKEDVRRRESKGEPVRRVEHIMGFIPILNIYGTWCLLKDTYLLVRAKRKMNKVKKILKAKFKEISKRTDIPEETKQELSSLIELIDTL